jgi:pimeloyl-ACP methyl ester carboxylesterase
MSMRASIKKYIAFGLLMGGLVSLQAAHGAPPEDLKGKNVVLVHGAFADGSSWNRVIPLLEARGLHVVSVQNPLSSLSDDAAAAKRVIDAQNGPVILVGHSWGGSVITEAGNDDKVKALVYVAAFAPDNGQSVNDIVKGSPAPVWASELRKDSAGYLTLSTKGILDDFAQDLPLPERRLIVATQGPWFAGCVDDKVGNAAWHIRPSWFVITDKDRMIDPRLQEAMAHEIGATVTHVHASHVAMLSHPKSVADVIIAAASKLP